MGYNEDLLIDEHQLDKEWLQQSAKYMIYAEKAAEADKDKKKSKEALDTIRAIIDTGIRRKAVETAEKITEKIVESRVILHPDYSKAHNELIDAEYDYSIYISAVRAMEQRKSALENLVKLFIGGYFSEPKADRMTEDEDLSFEPTKGISQTQKEQLNKKRKRRAEIKEGKDNV